MNQPRPPQSGRIFLVIVIALAAMATGLVVFSALFDRTQELRAAQPFPEARPMPEFELRTAAGEPLTSDDLKGRWSLVFFGFTNCPDICPDTLAVLDAVKNELETMKAAAQPQVVFVSVDPGRDDARALGEYVAMFDESFIGATASPEAIADFTRQLGVYFNLDEPDPQTGFYTVDHSASIYIVDPQGRLYGRFSPPLDRQAIAADLFALVR
jgi:protein SCO1/2